MLKCNPPVARAKSWVYATRASWRAKRISNKVEVCNRYINKISLNIQSKYANVQKKRCKQESESNEDHQSRRHLGHNLEKRVLQHMDDQHCSQKKAKTRTIEKRFWAIIISASSFAWLSDWNVMEIGFLARRVETWSATLNIEKTRTWQTYLTDVHSYSDEPGQSQVQKKSAR